LRSPLRQHPRAKPPEYLMIRAGGQCHYNSSLLPQIPTPSQSQPTSTLQLYAQRSVTYCSRTTPSLEQHTLPYLCGIDFPLSNAGNASNAQLQSTPRTPFLSDQRISLIRFYGYLRHNHSLDQLSLKNYSIVCSVIQRNKLGGGVEEGVFETRTARIG
jgi:hypothetical protein